MAVAPTSPDATPVPGRQPCVLIVDDNHDAAALLGEALRALGYRGVTVHDGPEALAAVERVSPDVALIDLGMPVMDGFEVARHLLSRPREGRIPLIAITGYGQPRDREASARAGFVAHLVKPVDLTELGQLLQTLLKV
jgi:CheY-like chemotaxis protein